MSQTKNVFPTQRIHPTVIERLLDTRDRLEQAAEREHGAGLVPDDLGAGLVTFVLGALYEKHRTRRGRFALHPHDDADIDSLAREACRIFASTYRKRLFQHVADARRRGHVPVSLEERRAALGDRAEPVAPELRSSSSSSVGGGETGLAVVQALMRGRVWPEARARAFVYTFTCRTSDEVVDCLRALGYAEVSPGGLRQWKRRYFLPEMASLRSELWDGVV